MFLILVRFFVCELINGYDENIDYTYVRSKYILSIILALEITYGVRIKGGSDYGRLG